MKRIILDYSKLTSEVLNLLVEKFPDGYDYDDIISFKNANSITVKAVEVRTDDTIYLVKISVELEESMEDFIEESEDENINDDDDLVLDIDDDNGEDKFD